LKLRTARVITYSVVAILAVLAIRATPPLAQPPAAAVLADSGPPPSWKLKFDSVARGETLVSVLERAGLSDTAAGHAVAAATSLDPRRIPTGLPVAVLNASPTDSEPTEIVVQLAVDHFLHLVRGDSGWTEHDERLPWKTDTVAIEGTIHSNLYQAVYAAANGVLPRDAQTALVVKLADDVYEYRVDMSRDLQDGDSFRVLAQRSTLSNGTVRIGDIVAAQLDLSGTEIDAVHFANDKVAGDYFDQNGRSLKAAFLRAPLKFKYISSGFGERFHPILKLWRDHKGIDYAANAGTPVRAIGNGVIVRAGWASGYGNLIEIRHPNGFSSRYGHLRAFAKGIHAGVRVDIGETIGYVGMTGLATGPHLHFEFLVHGVQRNPRIALRNVGGEPIPNTLMASFDTVRDRLMGQLLASTGGKSVTTVAQR
jgi:murein DD-endopeptidase MepM/ murein hydrolase activator NlpD